MKVSEYIQYDGLGLAQLVRDGQVKRRELLDCAYRIQSAVEPEINGFVELLKIPDEQSPGDSAAAFDGVPFAIKDLVCHMANQQNQMGSRLATGLHHEHDTHLMQRFRKAGLVTLGTTATPEFGFNVTAESVLTGVTRNPWDTDRMAGGSSGGSAAVVAAGVVPLAHANDGGGSIRIPASCCGLVGLKPSRGRISSAPDAAEGLNGMGVEFALTRTVRDSAALLDAVQGAAVGDPYYLAPPSDSYLNLIEGSPRKLRIAFTDTAWSGASVDADLKAALKKTVALCESLGHEVVEAMPALDYQEFFDCQSTLWTANLASLCTELSRQTGKPLNLDTLEAATLACYEVGMRKSVLDVYAALAVMNKITRSVAAFFQDYDLLLTPTNAKLPQPTGTYNQNAQFDNGLDWLQHIFSFAAFTALFNVTGQPAISLPLQRSDSGLPIGMQFAAPLGGEDTLLTLARQMEQAAPWPQISPLVDSLVSD